MEKITKVSNACIQLIEKFEGFKATAYLCPAGVPTIGFGSTYYMDGSKVKLGQVISKDAAYLLLKATLLKYEKDVDSMTIDSVNQNQFDALVDFAYNCGSSNLKGSTLLKKVNINPNDKTIANEFAKWVNAGGKKLQGLVNRRLAESNLYFSNDTRLA